MSQTSSDRSQRDTEKLSTTDYARFVGQIELSEIWLNSARITNPHGPQTPERTVISVDPDASWESSASGFRVLQHYHLEFRETDAVQADIEVTFGLDFTSNEPMTDQFFQAFQDVNLPVNTWPYLREFVATIMGRMGWQAVTLPTFKAGTSPTRRGAGQQEDVRPPPAKQRTRRSSPARRSRVDQA